MKIEYQCSNCGKWVKVEPIPYYRPCLAKRVGAKILKFLLGWWFLK